MRTELAPGAILGEKRYRLERLLGIGGMASVWLAHDERLERPVAVKVISAALAADEAFRRRFSREASIAASLSHPNLVRVLDAGTDEGRPYLVMEYVPGGTLAEYVRDGRPPPEGHEALAKDLLDALAYVHQAGILHRDVKPQNVLIDAHGGARLSDFGIARAAEMTELTAPGQMIGTLRYISPEVAHGAPATPLSDLYSLGVLLGECGGGSASPQIARLVDRLTRPEPERRPQSALAAKALLDSTPTEASPATGSGPPAATTSGRRRRALQGLSAAGAIALVVAVALLSGGGDADVGTPAEPRVGPDAPLSRQLDALDQAVEGAVRR